MSVTKHAEQQVDISTMDFRNAIMRMEAIISLEILTLCRMDVTMSVELKEAFHVC